MGDSSHDDLLRVLSASDLNKVQADLGEIWGSVEWAFLAAGSRCKELSDAAEREQLQRRRRVVDQDEELRAFMSLSVTQLTDHLRDAAAARAPEVDSGLVDLLAHALVAAAAHCTDEWTTSDIDEETHNTHVQAMDMAIAAAVFLTEYQ